MSSVVVPWSVPEPAVRATETSLLAPRPTVESLPKGSRLLTTGWLPKAEPAVALPGWEVGRGPWGAGGQTVEAGESAMGRPVALAVSTLPEPALSIRRLV